MVVRIRQQDYAMTDSDLRSALANGAINDFRRGRMGEAGLEMVLDRPEILETHLFGQFDLG
jgi:hypothetical protein